MISTNNSGRQPIKPTLPPSKMFMLAYKPYRNADLIGIDGRKQATGRLQLQRK
jgi:hypothetical protein